MTVSTSWCRRSFCLPGSEGIDWLQLGEFVLSTLVDERAQCISTSLRKVPFARSVVFERQVGLTDLSSVSMLSDEQRRGLCRLYRTMAELKGVDAASPSPAAERKARLAMEGVGLVIDLPPAGGIMSPALSVEAEIPEHSTDAEIVETNSWTPSDTSVDTSKDVEDHGGEGQGEEGGGEVGKSQSSGDEDGGQDEDEVKREIVVYGETDAVTSRAVEAQDPSSTDVLPSRPRAPLTHVMLLRGLFDTRREEALDLIGRGGDDLLRSMSVRRLPQAVVPVLRMVSNLRNVCAHLVSGP